mgnify:CR=1 FL=1
MIQYKFDAYSGEWKHRDHENSIMKLTDVSFNNRRITLINHPRQPEIMRMDKKYFDVSALVMNPDFVPHLTNIGFCFLVNYKWGYEQYDISSQYS